MKGDHDFESYLDKTKGDINTLGLASDYQELLTRMEVELQNLQDALINQDLHRAMSVLATEQNVGSLMGMKMEHALENNDPGVAPAYSVGMTDGITTAAMDSDAPPLIECPYCWRELQTVSDEDKVWVLPQHGHQIAGAAEQVVCPNSGKAPANFLIKE